MGEGLKTKKPVKTTKASMNPNRKAKVLLGLMMEKRLLKSDTIVPPWTGTCFAVSAMGGEKLKAGLFLTDLCFFVA